MHKTTCLLAAFLTLSLPGRAAEIPSSAVAEAEGIYADLADSYGIISTIDSGLFATYHGKDRAAWERIYGEKRKQLREKLGKITASALSLLDARALDVMNRHLRDDFPDQFRDENAPPERCQDAQRQDLSMSFWRRSSLLISSSMPNAETRVRRLPSNSRLLPNSVKQE